MRKAFCILAILLLLPGCAASRVQTGGEVDRTRPLCGSSLALEKAVRDADLIVHAQALEEPLGEVEEEGGRHYIARFRAVSALKGGIVSEEIRIHYDCNEASFNERGVEKGEEVILFVKMKPYRHAIKIIPAMRDAVESVKKLIGAFGG